MKFQNYHRHSFHTNPIVPDSCVSNEAYARRAVELGHGIISSCEHGYQGRYIECYNLAKEHDLTFVFSVEAYWVKDRLEKDNSNCHIFLSARNENGRQAINEILSEANESGFYHRARIDLELLFSLPKDDVIITSSCVAFWKYEDIEEIVEKLKDYFGKNFFLEVQYHHTDLQKEVNRKAIALANKYRIPLIMGCDSHYIYNEQATERDDYLVSKGIHYEQEEGWFMDYPDGETAFNRFVEQGVLTNLQIKQAMENTNVFLEVEEYDNPCFNKDIKMPTLYPELSQEERNQIFIDLIWNKWKEEKHKLPKERWSHYVEEIQKEIETVNITNQADYFLLNYEVIKEGKANGGVLTPTGRGSGVSNYTSKLLDLTMIDRIASPVVMYPERFMSATRMLESKTLADFDFNTSTVSIFADAQKKILGEEHSYPMLAYGTLKPKSAWKMYSKAYDIDFELTNDVSKQIGAYEKAVQLEDDEDLKELISPYDYIDKEYHELYDKSETYRGIISDWKIHPCAYLLHQRNIRKEIGLVKIKKNLCCLMDGHWAEKNKFLKNDLLKVSSIDLIDKVYKRIKVELPEINKLLELCENNEKVWDIYKSGCTIGVNQVEQSGTRARVAKYSPQNVSELSAFIAAIRPGFKSMYKTFENRESFSYGINSLDNLIRTPQFPQSFILYQEIQMKVLNYAGIPMTECYDIIKSIAKKREKEVYKYKEIFLDGFKNKMIQDEHKTESESQKLADDIWKIIADSARYSFNASHSYSMANDSLYGAYLKSQYPLYFYEVFLKLLEEKGEKDRMTLARNEAENYFNINFPPMRFRQDNRSIVADERNNAINMSLKSIKKFNLAISEQLYAMRDLQFDTFVDLLIHIEENYTLSTKIGDLIKLQYFQEFGNNGKLFQIYEEFKKGKNKYTKTLKSKGERAKALREFERNAEDKNLLLQEQLNFENEKLGYIQCTYDVNPRYAYVAGVDTKYAPRIDLYFLRNGKTESVKIFKKTFSQMPLEVGDIIDCTSINEKVATRLIDGQWVDDEDKSNTVKWLNHYKILRKNKK